MQQEQLEEQKQRQQSAFKQSALVCAKDSSHHHISSYSLVGARGHGDQVHGQRQEAAHCTRTHGRRNRVRGLLLRIDVIR